MGNQSAPAESNFMQNLLDNPGFEPSIECDLFKVGSQSGTSLVISNDNGECAGFWGPGGCSSDGSAGASGSVRIGGSAGQTFTVSANASTGHFTCSTTCPTLASGDWVSLCKQGPSVAANAYDLGAGWGPGGVGNSDAAVTLSTAQKYEGKTSLAIDVSGGASHQVQFTWDSATTTGGVCSNDNVTACTSANQTLDCGSGNTCKVAPESGPWHPVVAGKSYEIAFYALGSGTSAGTPSVSVTLGRSGGGTNTSHSFTLTNDSTWHQYSYTFTGADTASTIGTLSFALTATNGSAEAGAKIYIDDAYVGLASAASTGFRPELVTTLQTINPGSLRYMIPLTLNANDAVFEGPSGCTPGAVGIAGYKSGGCDYLRGGSTTDTGTNNYSSWSWWWGSADMYALAGTLGAAPWFSIPNTFSDTDLTTFADNVCAAISTYGLPSVWIEQSNEDWNGAGPGAKFDAVGGLYGALAGRNFNVLSTEISAKCPSSASAVHYIIGNQECNDGVLAAALIGASAAGFPIPNTSAYGSDDATYVSGLSSNPGELPDYSGTPASRANQYATTFFDYAAGYNFGPICVARDKLVLGSNQTMSVYESGVGAFNGPGTTEEAYLSEGGFASAGWMAENWLLGIQSLLPVQNAFTLAQVEYGIGGGPIVPAWGVVHDLDADFGPTFPHLRPTGLALALINRAIAGDYYPMDTSAFGGVYGVAFQTAGHWSAAISNSNSHSVTIAVQFPSGSALPTSAETVLFTNSMADNNENSNLVKIGPLPGGIATAGQTTTITIPAYSVVALEP
jgi:hypothetical protein